MIGFENGKPNKEVIFDWAGTTIDYGYMTPKNVFVENSFENTAYFLLNIENRNVNIFNLGK